MIRTALARGRPDLVPVVLLAVFGFAAAFGLALLAAGFADVAAGFADLARAAGFFVAALAASNSRACSRLMVSAVVPSGKEAFSFPCFT